MLITSNKITPALLSAIIIAATACKKDHPGTDTGTQTITELKKAWVTTIAGSGFSGFVDAPAAAAKFSRLNGIAVTTDGTIYVADKENSRIRKIANGQVSTVAGNGTYEIKDGAGPNAHFKYPAKIVFGVDGNLFLTDFDNYTIRTLTPGGVVKNYAGRQGYGHENGDTSIATFNMSGTRVAFNEAGDMFVPDTYNNLIRKVTRAGQVTTYAGTGIRGRKDGDLTNAQFDNPYLAVVDKQGNLVVFDQGNFVFRKISKDGKVTTLSGSGILGYLDGKATKAQFSWVEDMVADSKGNIYILDQSAIRRIDPNGEVITIAGNPVSDYKDGRGDSARFNSPEGLTIDQKGDLYVADSYNYRVRKISFQ